MNKQYVYEWIASELAGEINEDAKQSLAEWRKLSNENENEYQEAITSWNAAGPAEKINYPDAVFEWSQLTKKIDRKSRILNFNRMVTQGYKRKWMAAAVVILCVLSGAAWKFVFSPVTLTTPAGMRSSWVLPDGSSVALNAGSRLIRSRRFGSDVRRVKLEGEGYFQVTHSGKPFIVETDNARIRVLGTRFHVRSRNSTTRLIVTQGKVSFARQGSNSAPQILTAGQLSVCRSDSEPGPISQIEPAEVVGWQEGKLIFISMPLSEILAEISRVFNVTVQLGEGVNGNNLLTFINYENSAENVLQAVATVMQLDLIRQNQKFILQ